MRKLLFILCIAFALPVFAFETDGGSIKSVSLYQNSALIMRDFKAQLNKGENTIVIKGMSAMIDPASIRFMTETQGIKVNEVGTETTYLNNKMQEKLEDLTAKLDKTDKQIRAVTDDITVLKNSADFVRKVAPFGQNQKISASEITEYLKFVELTLSIKNSKIADAENNLKSLKELKNNLEREISAIKNGKDEAVNVVISLNSTSDKTADFTMTYVTEGAGWSPVFEMRADSAAANAEFSAYASIRQTTGEDWKNVALEISTLSPTYDTMPEISPWYLDIYKRAPIMYDSMPKAMIMPRELMEKASAPMPEERENLTSFSFVLGGKVSVPADGQTHKILLKTEKADADFSLYAVPKMSAKAFLTADVKNPFNFPILEGDMNVYLDENLVNTIGIDESIPSGEELSVSLGADENIKIERKEDKKSGTKGVFSKDEKINYSFEIAVTNAKKKAVKITIDEATPISQNDAIKVELGEYTKENSEIEDGIITWNLTLKPSEKKIIKGSFSVQYPEDETIKGL